MKSLEIKTNKRLLIVEKQIEVNGQDIDVSESIIFGVEKMMKGKAKFICRGSDLTEEIAAGMVESPDNFQFLDALNTFIGELQKKGWYWGENPLGNKEPEDISDLGEFTQMMRRKHKAWKAAESRTFHPERVLIFEIVEG